MSDELALSVQEIADRSFVEHLTSTEDHIFLDEIARKGAVSWSMTRAVTILACYRQKQLFDVYISRERAFEATGYTSWTNWLESIEIPASDGLIRQRCVEVHEYRRIGLDWMTILNFLAYSPTAASEVLTNVLDDEGNVQSHIDVSRLPGGSVEGLFDAIAAISDPGQARRLVSDVSGRVAVYATDGLATDGRVYLTVTYEHPESNETLYLTVSAHTEAGDIVEMPDNVARWIMRKFGVTPL